MLTKEEEASLRKLGDEKGLSAEDMDSTIDDGAAEARNAKRTWTTWWKPPPAIADGHSGATRRMRTNRVANITPTDEFKRMLSLSGLDSDSMTDDQRDALINMAENLGPRRR